MYNKLFTKILDSSIWLENHATVRVWFTLMAAMDEDGYCSFASAPNLAHRARVSLPEVTDALKCLESPDPNSSDPDHDGRRVERVPGGWVVLNAVKYRELATRLMAQEKTRARVAKHRKIKKEEGCNADVTVSTPSETHSHSESKQRKRNKKKTLAATAAAERRIAELLPGVEPEPPPPPPPVKPVPFDTETAFREFYGTYPKKVKPGKAKEAYIRALRRVRVELNGTEEEAAAFILGRAKVYTSSPLVQSTLRTEPHFIPHPASWLNSSDYNTDPAEWQHERSAARLPTAAAPRNAAKLSQFLVTGDRA